MGDAVSPLTEELDKEKYRKTVHELCDSLSVPGVDIPADAEVVLSNALLSRDFDVAKLCAAALHILISDVKVKVYLNAAWRGDVATLDRFLADGSLIAFLNTWLMQALTTLRNYAITAFYFAGSTERTKNSYEPSRMDYRVNRLVFYRPGLAAWP